MADASSGDPECPGRSAGAPGSAAVADAYRKHALRKSAVILFAAIAALAVCALALTLGSAGLDAHDALSALLGMGDPRTTHVVINIRLLRILGAAIAGSGLALAGCVLQNVLHNPLASDYTLGVSQGAAFGAAVAILLFGAGTANAAGAGHDSLIIRDAFTVAAFAFAGAITATLTIVAMAKWKGITPETMVLAGIAMGSLFSASTVLVQYFATDVQVASIVFWTFGDLGRASWQKLSLIAAVVLPSSLFFVLKRWDLNTLGAGEDVARSLGVDVRRLRLASVTLASLVTATTVSFLGIIAFVGLVAPHAMRRLVGNDHRYLVPASLAAGALLLVTADTIARTIVAPVVLPVGAITSFAGAPLFLYLLLRDNRTGRHRK